LKTNGGFMDEETIFHFETILYAALVVLAFVAGLFMGKAFFQ